MDNIQISEMTILDLEEIKDTLLSDFDDFWNINTFKQELLNPNSKYIMAKINNKIVGFAGIWKSVDDVHITNIVTAKKFRKQNIGSKMLLSLIKMAKSERNINSITLEVNSNNIPAQRLYEKFGFDIVGLRKKYYNNIDDAIIYTKDLTN
jgi:ribosomal-protein-alanine N-acetyltransferase